MQSKLKLFLILSGLMIVFLIGCEADNPESIFNPDDKGGPKPEIIQVNPQDSTLAGIGEMTITGKNFSSNPEENYLYFNQEKIEILQATATELRIKTPNIPSDSIAIKIGVHGAFEFSNIINYKLLRVWWDWGNFDDYDNPYGLAMDSEENLYVSNYPKMVDKITPTGERIKNWGSTAFTRASDMKMGPDGYIYAARVHKSLYRFPPEGGQAEKWADAPGKIYALDFAEGGIMFCGGKNDDLYRMNPDGSGIKITPYPSVYIKAVRVYDGYVYVGGEDRSNGGQYVWRNQIISADSLAEKEIVFDYTTNYSDIGDILSLAFAADGDMYIGTSGAEAIVVVHPDGSHEPLYPGVIEPESNSMVWGNGNYLYICRRNDDVSKRRIIKLNMLKKSAPYYGR